MIGLMCLVLAGCSGNNKDYVSSDAGKEAESVNGTECKKEVKESAESADSKEKEKNTSLPDRSESGKKHKPRKQDMVLVSEYIPDIYIDLKYAAEDNFTGKRIYDFDEAYLRYGTVKKLKRVQSQLKKEGLALLIWDAYRPVKAQYRLWEICPNSKYVADPNTGYSSHSRGNTVDVTIVSRENEKIKMPTGFDDFSAKADRDYSDCTAKEAENARKLENLMKKAGFRAYQGEWWHFSDTESYPVKKLVK